MLRLVLTALRARREQTLALFVLTVLASTGAAAAPWFLAWADRAVAESSITSAPAIQRVVVLSSTVNTPDGGLPFAELRSRAAAQLVIPGAVDTAGARIFVSTRDADAPGQGPGAGLYLNHREGICERLTVEGSCEGGPGEVLLARSTADVLGVGIGDSLLVEGFRLTEPHTVRVSGLYGVVRPLDPYWAGTDLLGGPNASGSVIDAPAFISQAGLLALEPTGVEIDLHLVLPVAAYDDPDLRATLTNAQSKLRQASLGMATQVPDLIRQVARDRLLVTLAVGVATVQLVLLCWFTLFLAVRHTADDRRPDLGLLKLRGSSRWRLWALSGESSAIPMLAGAAAGWVLGAGAAMLLTGAGPDLLGTVDPDVARVSAAAAGGTCVGALISAVLAESRALRAPVASLLRRVPERRTGGRTGGIVDIIVVALAAAGVYQGYSEGGDGDPSVLTLLAPGLVALAIGLLAARALPWLAARVGAGALRAGRVGPALGALHIARRPGAHRVFAVVSVAVSVLATALIFGYTATTAWSDRAVQELGSQRVDSVTTPNSTTLLAAVRQADPGGRHAMAVARSAGARPVDRVLAVDTTRLAAVADLGPSFDSGEVERLTGLLRPPAPAPVFVHDGPVTVEASPAGRPADDPAVAPGADPAVGLRLHLVGPDGAAHTVDVGPVSGPRRAYRATVAGCPGRAGCRLAALELLTEGPVTVDVFRVAQAGGDVVAPAVLGDVTRWRPRLGPVGVGNVIAARDGHLAISRHTGPLPPGQRSDPRVFLADVPTPLPVLLAGSRPQPDRAGDDRFRILGAESLPYTVIGQTRLLPRLDEGALVDLEYAQRSVAATVEVANFEVWLSDDAPPGIVDRLRAAGLEVIDETDMAAVTRRLSGQGPGVALRFQVFAALVVLLLAAGIVAVMASVERRPRAAELRALRTQGLRNRSARLAGYGGTLVVVTGALLTGLLAAVVAEAVVAARTPVFSDGWHLLPLHVGAQPVPMLAVAAVATLVLGTTALVGSNRLVRAVRRGWPGGRP
jgi:putative ABC transport system permease protein